MTDPTTRLIDLVLLLDRTGSMAGTWKEAVAGVNFVIDDQRRQPGRARLTLATFDAFHREPILQLVHDRVPIEEVPRFPDDGSIQPRGSTPLLDAMYALLGHVRARIAELPQGERPDGVAFAVFTDGMENRSRELRGAEGFATLSALVAHCEREGWQFSFVGAGLEEIAAQARQMGLGPDSSRSVSGDAVGTSSGFESISGDFTGYRRRGGSSSGGGQVH